MRSLRRRQSPRLRQQSPRRRHRLNAIPPMNIQSLTAAAGDMDVEPTNFNFNLMPAEPDLDELNQFLPSITNDDLNLEPDMFFEGFVPVDLGPSLDQRYDRQESPLSRSSPPPHSSSDSEGGSNKKNKKTIKNKRKSKRISKRKSNRKIYRKSNKKKI